MVRVHVIVVGCGRVGSGLAVGLMDQGHSVAVIDRNAKAFRRLPPDWPGTLLIGSGFDRDTLDKAGAAKAESLAAVTSGDNSNILTARIARETYEIPNVVARIYDPASGPDLPAARHPHGGHRVLDHRPGAPAAGPRRR